MIKKMKQIKFQRKEKQYHHKKNIYSKKSGNKLVQRRSFRNKGIQQRKRRFRSQNDRIFLLQGYKDQLKWKFIVTEDKGYQYFIQIGQNLICTCFDFKQRRKPSIQIELTQDVNDDICSISKQAFQDLNQRLKQRLRPIMDKLKKFEEQQMKQHIASQCSICFEKMDEVQDELQSCQKRFNYFHEKCLQKWKEVRQNCPLCRQYSSNSSFRKIRALRF